MIYTDCGIQIYHSHAAQPAEIVAAKSQDYHQAGNLDEYIKPILRSRRNAFVSVLLHLFKDLLLVHLDFVVAFEKSS